MKRLVILIALIFCASAYAQVSFSESFTRNMNAASVNMVPAGYDFFADDFNNLYENPKEGNYAQWQLAVKHKTLPLKFYITMKQAYSLPDLDSRVTSIISEMSCTSDGNSEIFDNWIKYFRGTSGVIGYGHSCYGYPYAPEKTEVVIVANSNTNSYIEFIAVFEDTEEVNEVKMDLYACFRFKMQNTNKTNFAGVGIVYGYEKDKRGYVIKEVVKDHVAEEAGILPGDIIDQIDSTYVDFYDMDEVWDAITGEEGTIVHMQVIRYGLYYNYDLKRKKLVVSDDMETLTRENMDVYGEHFCRLAYWLSNTSVDKVKGDYIERGLLGDSTYEANFDMPVDISGTYTEMYFSDVGWVRWLTYDIAEGSAADMVEKYNYYAKIMFAYYDEMGYSYKGDKDLASDAKEGELSMQHEEWAILFGSFTLKLEEVGYDGSKYRVRLTLSM